MKKKNVEKISKSYLNELQNLPVTSNRNSDDTNKMVKLPCVQITGSRSRKAFKKKNIKTIFTSSSSLKSLLCRNKTKLLANSNINQLIPKLLVVSM